MPLAEAKALPLGSSAILYSLVCIAFKLSEVNIFVAFMMSRPGGGCSAKVQGFMITHLVDFSEDLFRFSVGLVGRMTAVKVIQPRKVIK